MLGVEHPSPSYAKIMDVEVAARQTIIVTGAIKRDPVASRREKT